MTGKSGIAAFLTSMLLLAAADWLLPGAEHGDEWLSIPGFFVLFGFAGCVLIIWISKKLGGLGLQQPETYYEPGGDREGDWDADRDEEEGHVD